MQQLLGQKKLPSLIFLRTVCSGLGRTIFPIWQQIVFWRQAQTGAHRWPNWGNVATKRVESARSGDAQKTRNLISPKS